MADQNSANLERQKFGWEVLKFLVLSIAAAFSFLANQQSVANARSFDKYKAEADQRIQQARMEADQRSQQAQLDLRIYELVEKTVSLEAAASRGRGVAVAALVNALTTPPLRVGLMNALRSGCRDEVLIKQLDAAQEFDAAEVQTGRATVNAVAKRPKQSSSLENLGPYLLDAFAPRAYAQSLPGPLKGFHVDILYCEGQTASLTEGRRRRAQAAADLLKPAIADVTVRVRSLPLLVQARPEYRSVADEIRFNDQPSDRDAASFLAKVIAIPPHNVRKMDYQAPNYVNVFYCAY